VGEQGQRQHDHQVRRKSFRDTVIASNRIGASSDLRKYLEHIMKSTNMACLTPDAALSGDCDFLSANLCARSLFGEDALANLSIEKTEEGVIQGHVRIRSKTQGIALSLGESSFRSPELDTRSFLVSLDAGDKITLAQKAIVTAPTV
jgi:hypothetical protein